MHEKNEQTRVAFVTGGSGFVGGRLIRALLSQGWEVRALSRSPKAASCVKALGATPVLGELTDRKTLARAMAGTQIVFHAAALFKMWGTQDEFNTANIEGTRALVEAAVETLSVRKVVLVSASAVVQGDPEALLNIDEQAPVQQRSFAPYSTSKAAAEQLLIAAHGRRDGFETIAIRPPMIWGVGMPMLDQMIDVVRSGKWQWPDKGSQALSTCHVDNLVDALLLAGNHGHGVYFVADAETGTLEAVVRGLLATRGVSAGDKSVPFNVAWTLAGAMGFIWRTFKLKGEPPITRQMLRLIGKPFTLNTAKARRELGYVPRVSWDQGIAEMQA